MRELRFVRSGRLAWHERPAPELQAPGDALVRPFLAGRCDGDTLPIHRPVSRALQAGMALGLVDPVVGAICGKVPFRGPFAVGHECVAEIVALGPAVSGLHIGQRVVVPWAVSCGACPPCRRGLTAKCATTGGILSAYGFGTACGPWGGMVTDVFRVPFAEHMLVPVPPGVPSARAAAASDNLADAWRTVVPALAARPGGTVLVLGGGATSIGLYAAGLAVAHHATVVDYLDDDPERRAIAESLGARAHPATRGRTTLTLLRRASHSGSTTPRPSLAGYDVVVEATSRPAGLRRALASLAPGGVCTAVGYYLSTGTRLPLMRMYATDATLHIGVSHTRTVLPELLDFLDHTGFPAENVTTLTAPWDDAPTAYTARTTKLVLHRPPLAAT